MTVKQLMKALQPLIEDDPPVCIKLPDGSVLDVDDAGPSTWNEPTTNFPWPVFSITGHVISAGDDEAGAP